MKSYYDLDGFTTISKALGSIPEEVQFSGEVTKEGAQYGFFNGWDNKIEGTILKSHRYLPSVEDESITNIRYTKNH